jgi:hypothetical protein
MGSDYFIFRKELFQDIPAFALGRAGWDNWMIYAGRRAGGPVIDASEAITVVHQNHDYHHLPGGQPHYQLPESRENVKMAGGAETVFTLRDATWKLDALGVRRKPLMEIGLLRWIESSLFCIFGPGIISKAIRMLFHPLEIWRYVARHS